MHRLAYVAAAAVIAAGPAAARAAKEPPDGALAARGGVAAVAASFDVEQGRAGETVVLRAWLRDGAGRSADAPLHVQVDGGKVGQPQRLGPGVYTARVTLPTDLSARRVLLVTAAAGRGAASVALPLAPGPPASMDVEMAGDLPADGTAHPIWVGVSDAHGNPSTEVPRVTARRGAVSEPVPLTSGGWVVHYRSPRDTRAGEDVITFVAGSANASTTLRLVPMRPVLSFDVRGGAVLGTGAPSAAVAGDVATWRRVGGVRLGLVLAAAWWSNESRHAVPGPGGSLDLASRRAWLPVTLSAASRLQLGTRVVATLSVGGGGALVTSRTTLAGEAAVAELGWAPVGVAGLELALRVRGGEPLVAVQGAWLGDPHLETLRGDAWPVSLFLGYRFHAY